MSRTQSRLPSSSCLEPQALRDCIDGTMKLDDTIIEHLGSCPQCQVTMGFVAGQEQWWQEAQQFLSQPAEPAFQRICSRICSLTSIDSGPEDPTILLDHEREQLHRILDAPSHPELLGRIGRYELEQLVGRGGMGLVFRAYDSELYRVVAIKTLAFHLVPIGAARDRFIRESRACAALTHPHIVPMYDVIHDGPIPALVMQYIAGPSLQQWLHDHGPMSWQHGIQIASQLADALAAAHELGIIHRDIKPGNVLLEAEGMRALLTDFGLARVLDAATLTHSGLLAGTPEYMSPEQARGELVDERSDLFSLGSLLYTMLAGSSPFRASEPMAILHRVCHLPHVPLNRVQPEVPIEVSKLVDRLLSKQPKHRFASAVELRDELHELSRSKRSLRRRPESIFRKRVVWLSLSLGLIGMILGMARWGESPKSVYSHGTPFEHGSSKSRDLVPTEVVANEYESSSSMNASNSLNTHARILSSFFADIQSLDRELDAIWEILRNSIAWQPPSHELIRVENGSTMNDGMVDRIEMELNEVNQTLRRLEIELQPDRK